jgi:hypothetical protein
MERSRVAMAGRAQRAARGRDSNVLRARGAVPGQGFHEVDHEFGLFHRPCHPAGEAEILLQKLALVAGVQGQQRRLQFRDHGRQARPGQQHVVYDMDVTVQQHAQSLAHQRRHFAKTVGHEKAELGLVPHELLGDQHIGIAGDEDDVGAAQVGRFQHAGAYHVHFRIGRSRDAYTGFEILDAGDGTVLGHRDDDFVRAATGMGNGRKTLIAHQQRGVIGIGEYQIDLAGAHGGTTALEVVVEFHMHFVVRGALQPGVEHIPAGQMLGVHVGAQGEALGHGGFLVGSRD